MIKINNLSFSYGRTSPILKNITLEINKGDYLAILGRNGSGKSTLVKCLLGINNIKTGNVNINNQNVNQIKSWDHIGYVEQYHKIETDIPMSIYEYLSLYDNQNMINNVVQKLAIKDLLNKNIANLSGGESQKINIAKSLLKKEIEYLILDEPTVGIDKKSVQNFYKLIKKLNEEGLTIIIITHQFEEIDCEVKQIFNIEENKTYPNSKNNCQFC